MLSHKTLSFWLAGALAWLLLLSSPINAAPTGLIMPEDTYSLHPLTDTTPLVSRDTAAKDKLPTSKEDLRTKFFKKAPKKDKSCFFTGMDVDKDHTPAQNTAEAKKQCKTAKLVTLDSIWSKNNILNQGEWEKPIANPDWDNFLNWVSEIFAEETSGVAYLLLPENSKPRKESIFYSKEFPAMKDKNQVDKIMNVKFSFGSTPTLPDPTKDDNVWWKKGAADPPTRDEATPTPAPAPAPAPAAVSLQCFGTGKSKYINRDSIMKVIDIFCGEAANQDTLDKDSGSIARTYNKDTPEQVDIAMDYRPGLNWYVDSYSCIPSQY
jgi:hypothetical protein